MILELENWSGADNMRYQITLDSEQSESIAKDELRGLLECAIDQKKSKHPDDVQWGKEAEEHVDWILRNCYYSE